MQEYGRIFAEVYSKRWTQFSAFIGPLIMSYYEKAGGAAGSRLLLDLCCGTGQFKDLKQPLADPEKEGRVVFIARR